MLPDGVRRMVDEWAVKPGERAVVVGEGAATVKLQLARSKTFSNGVIDLTYRLAAG